MLNREYGKVITPSPGHQKKKLPDNVRQFHKSYVVMD